VYSSKGGFAEQYVMTTAPPDCVQSAAVAPASLGPASDPASLPVATHPFTGSKHWEVLPRVPQMHSGVVGVVSPGPGSQMPSPLSPVVHVYSAKGGFAEQYVWMTAPPVWVQSAALAPASVGPASDPESLPVLLSEPRPGPPSDPEPLPVATHPFAGSKHWEAPPFAHRHSGVVGVVSPGPGSQMAPFSPLAHVYCAKGGLAKQYVMTTVPPDRVQSSAGAPESTGPASDPEPLPLPLRELCPVPTSALVDPPSPAGPPT
jgi:hypothetical protein